MGREAVRLRLCAHLLAFVSVVWVGKPKKKKRLFSGQGSLAGTGHKVDITYIHRGQLSLDLNLFIFYFNDNKAPVSVVNSLCYKKKS